MKTLFGIGLAATASLVILGALHLFIFPNVEEFHPIIIIMTIVSFGIGIVILALTIKFKKK